MCQAKHLKGVVNPHREETVPRPGIECPFCGCAVSSVRRTTPRGATVQRKRKCSNAKCHKQFLTYEMTSKARSDTGVAAAVISLESALKALRSTPPVTLSRVALPQED